MGIAFNCEYCGKKIQAPDNAGGKWGKCPACHNKLYIPAPDSNQEELKLAPIDEKDIAKQKQLTTETFKLTQEILSEKEIPKEPVEAVVTSASSANNEQLTTDIITYLRQMADGDLDQTQRTAELITNCGSRAVKILDEIALSEIPEPELADIPQQVLSRLIRILRSKIS